ncbi:LOW QUALITY PROTEIN: lysM domain protein [Colletotrichum tofieldiae]|uniref:LysM domain protein n=1 Tax=Colletotrichum tofieldiae TaxID=708197 RepID=A0A166W1V1_9PEZI|nr:LysM domain protein [Colletotrichum tofieldiae]GKT66170.1 LOW QUALITY PROTEIN: LysM domain protein [Colletotrichum tofieldiae]GKT70662.1 LOW QUALITY PROTEIN: lysM domain protein [Colletotrichum tofieldiae]GKT94446.1 LOW QUALITY PROTEIN: lysM domain protein [Colletotrichum tofieldiae]
MPGVVADCDCFYKVQSGDQCDTIAQKNGITVAQLKFWNADINVSCSNLWLDYYVCARVPGAVTPTTRTKATTAPGPTNTPQLPGAAGNCDKWYKIASGDTCDTVAAKNKIAVAIFAEVDHALLAMVSHESPETTLEKRLQLDTMPGMGVVAPGLLTQAQ